MIVQILLFVFLVAGFSAAETQDPIHENFSQFFNAIAVNDTGEISKQGDILRAEVVKQKETFDAIGRRQTGFVLSNRNSSLIKRDDGSLVNDDADADKLLNDEEREYATAARNLMQAVGGTDAKKRETLIVHLYAKEKSALKAAEKKTTEAEKDKDTFKDFIKKLYCPTEIRYSVERFSQTYLSSPDVAMRRMGTIQSELGTMVNSTFGDLKASVQTISSVAKKLLIKQETSTGKSETTTVSVTPEESVAPKESVTKPTMSLEQKFNKYWLRLREALASTVEHTEVCQTARFHEGERTLTESILELACVETVEEARRLHSSKLSFWKGNARLNDVGKNDLKLLSYEEILRRVEHGPMKIKLEYGLEKDYASVFLKIKRHYSDKGLRVRSNYYKDCMNVLYFSNNYNILRLRQRLMEKEYLDQPLYLKGDSYCEDLSILYNMVSNINKHTAGYQPPSIDCNPEEVHFIEFVKFLNKNFESTGMGFVAASLYGGIKFYEKMQSTTTSSVPTPVTSDSS